ncbi:MAG: alpha/beta hydrolase, partial [Polaromonas sp.]|nr:alpha/beta hydrolase [Polaromonas sp.]
MRGQAAHALLTPAMRDVISRMGRAGHPAFHTLTATQARA